MDEKDKFAQALQHFRELIGRDSASASAVCAAYQQLWDKNVAIHEEDDSGAYENAQAPFLNNGNICGPSLLYYLADAIDLYERRKDAHQGQTALLFEPSCPHIKEIRHLIHVLKDSTVAFAEATPEYALALALEQALNDVQTNIHIPQTAKRDHAMLRVSGYADYAAEPQGKGVVVRDYSGTNNPMTGKAAFDGQAVIELASDALIPHLLERNVLDRYANTHNNAAIDMAVIDRAGDVHRFNHYNPSRRGQPGCFNDIRNKPSDPAATDFLQEIMAVPDGRGIQTVLSDAQLDAVERQYLPYLATARPPLVSPEPRITK